MNTQEVLVRMEELGDEIRDLKQELRFDRGYHGGTPDVVAQLTLEIEEKQRELSRLRGVVSRWSRFWYVFARIVLSGSQ